MACLLISCGVLLNGSIHKKLQRTVRMAASNRGLLNQRTRSLYKLQKFKLRPKPKNAIDWVGHIHGGTTEEGNCSYLLPRAAAARSKRHIYGPNPQNSRVWNHVICRMVGTRSQMGAYNGILVCLVREIWQFKLFAGKEVTAVPATRREGGYWRRGTRSLCLCWNWIASFF